MAKPNDDFGISVFVNCPFDQQYRKLLHALLFTLIYCGMRPRIASERGDAGEIRLDKILELLKESKFSIHDLSRMVPLASGDLPRFNMPFELGIEIGIRAAATGKMAEKRCLVLEKESYRYQAVLSDISGNDIKVHREDPETLIRQVRNWLVENLGPHFPSGRRIWQAYNEFLGEFERETADREYGEYDIREMPVVEFMYFVHLLSKPHKLASGSSAT